MARQLLMWELDPGKIPLDPKERVAQWGTLCAMVEQDMKAGVTRDWASFVGGMKGYAVAEGTDLEIAATCMKYMPFVRFEAHPLTSLAEMVQMLKNAPR